MTRLILAIFVALSLAANPGPAFAAPSPECSRMQAGEMDMGTDHRKMGCCTPECAISCPAGVVPAGGVDLHDTPFAAAPPVMAIAEALHSFSPGAIDPPPRA